MAFFQSNWFTWLCGIIIGCTIITNLWISFVEESGTEPSEILRIVLKIIFFIPMLILGIIISAVEKKAWGAIIIVVIMITAFVVAWIYGTPEAAPDWH